MKSYAIWEGGILACVGAILFFSWALSGKNPIYGSYRIDAGVVDVSGDDGLRTVKGMILLKLNTAEKDSIPAESKQISLTSGGFNDRVSNSLHIDPSAERHITIPSVVEIPFAGHYSIKSPPGIEVRMDVNGKEEVVDLSMESN